MKRMKLKFIQMIIFEKTQAFLVFLFYDISNIYKFNELPFKFKGLITENLIEEFE